MPRFSDSHKKYRFTLIELLTVIAVIGVLMGMSIGVFSYVSTRMAEAKTRAIIAKLESALETYKSKYGMYLPFPMTALSQAKFFSTTNSRVTAFYLDDTLTSFNVLIDYEGLKANDSAVKTGTTTPRWIVDAFGNPIVYRCPGFYNRNSYDLGSMGSDGLPGDGQSQSTETNWGYTTNAGVWGKGDDITNFTRK